MSQRRPHTKSRHGCLQCKQSRIKCDEDKPSCKRCVRTGRSCSLQNANSHSTFKESSIDLPSDQASLHRDNNIINKKVTVAESSPSTVSIPESTDRLREPEPISIPEIPNFTDSERTRLKLMNHYACTVTETIAELTLPGSEGLNLWRNEVPRLAFEHDLLLHGVLGVSALHLALTEPSTSPSQQQQQNTYLALAMHHHDLGSTLFRPHLTNLTATNIEALYAFSCIVTLHCFGIHRTALSQRNSLAKLHEVLSLLRGTGLLVRTGLHWLRSSPWGPTLLTPDMFVDPPRLSQEIEDMLDSLSQRVHSSISTSAHSTTYNEAIRALRLSLVLAKNHPHTQAMLVLFPVIIPSEYLTMMCIGEPLALSILANWAVIPFWLRKHVWLDGWGEQTIVAVREALPDDWSTCIQWAVGEMDRGLSGMN